MEKNFLRKLNPYEHLLSHYIENYHDFIYPTTFLIESKTNLFEFKKKVEETIIYWKNLHPLLCCHIQKSGHDLVYVSATEQIKNSLDNVKFLRIKDISYSDSWKLIHENELENSFNIETDLLWRLFILEFDDKSESFFKYAFIINLYHSISDGSNNFALIAELLSLIEKNLLDKLEKPGIDRILFSKFEYDFPNDPREGQKSQDLSVLSSNAPENNLIQPNFLKSLNKTFPRSLNGVFVDLDGQVYSSAESLNQNNQKSNTGFVFKDISSEIFKNFISKCKQNGVKINSAFEVLTSIAYKNLILKSNENINDYLTNKYEVTINMRPYLGIPNLVMGSWIAYFTTEINLDFDESDSDFWSNKFWNLCKKKCENLHDYIDKKTFLDTKIYEEVANWIYVLQNDPRLYNLMINYSLTNLGDQTNQNQSQMIKIKKYYTSLSYTKCTLPFGLIATCSIDKESFWSFTYNRKIFDDQFANTFLDLIKNYIENI